MIDVFCMYVGIFCGPRASEVMGLQWKSWIGEAPIPHGTAYEGQFYKGRLKSKASKGPIPVPEQVQPVLAAWRQICQDPSPEALMFPTFGRGKRKGQAVPRWGTEELPEVADSSDRPKVGSSRILGHLPGDAPHSGNGPNMQAIEASILEAVNSRTRQILAGWRGPVISGAKPIVPKARQRRVRGETGVHRNWTKLDRA